MPGIFDDFNRAGPGLGSDYSDVLNLVIDNNELIAPTNTWGEAEITGNLQNLPTAIEYDFWVPPDPADGYHGIQVNSRGVNVYGYIDNSGAVGPTYQWKAYLPDSVSTSHSFDVTGDTWYRAKWLLHNESGGAIKFKVWLRGDPEPLTWDAEGTRGSTASIGSHHYIYLDADGGNTYPTRIDNLHIYDFEEAFTADARLYPLDGVIVDTFTANARIVGPPVFEDDFNRVSDGPAYLGRAPDGTPWHALNDWASFLFPQSFVDGERLAFPSRLSTPGGEGYLGPPSSEAGTIRVDFYVPYHQGYEGFWDVSNGLHTFYNGLWRYQYVYVYHQSTTSPEYFITVGDITWVERDLDHDTWYTLKGEFNSDGVTTSKVKVWKRDDPEPVEWDTEAIYPGQAADGSALRTSLFINSSDNMPGFFDNYVVESVGNNVTWTRAFTADAVLKKTHQPYGGSGFGLPYSNSGISSVQVTNATLTVKSASVTTGMRSFIFFSMDGRDADSSIQPWDIRFIERDGWTVVKKTRLPTGNDSSTQTDHWLVTLTKVWRAGEGNTQVFNWNLARRFAWGTVAVSGTDSPDAVFKVIDTYERTLKTTHSTVADVDAPVGRWSAFIAFAGSVAATWSTPTGTAQFVDVNTTGATISVNRDDFNVSARGDVMPSWTTISTVANPTMAHAVIVHGPDMTFTADAFLFKPISVTFTANAWLETPYHTFTADAWLKKIWQKSITADALIVNRIEEDFTADAVLLYDNTKTFIANAWLHRPIVVPPPVVPGVKREPGELRLHKNVTMEVLKRRPLAMSAYIPPTTPDTDDEEDDLFSICLPPCSPLGAGAGTLYGAMGGPTKEAITRCSNCGETFFRVDTEYLGRGGDTATSHCDCTSSHSALDHVTKLFVDYGTFPAGAFRLRAKLLWDANISSGASVKVYGNILSMPFIDVDTCGAIENWDAGELLGTFHFVADGSGTVGGRSVVYQQNPAAIGLNGANLSTSIVRYEMSDNIMSYHAKFRAANLSMSIL